MSILVRRAKNDPFGDGRYGYLTPQTVEILKDWLEAAAIQKDWLFRKVSGHRIGSNALHPYTVNLIIKGAADAAGSTRKSFKTYPVIRCGSAPRKIL